MTRLVFAFVFVGFVATTGFNPTPGRAADEPAKRPVEFERDVKPILAANCFKCHGERQGKGGLRLHRRVSALAGGDGGKIISPGKSEESRLYRLIAGLDDEAVMPPEGSGRPLAPEQISKIKAWIDQGATWPESADSKATTKSDHWSFKRPLRPDLPRLKDASRIRNAIDYFVIDRLEKAGLTLSPEADRETLIRRVSLDLIGLPPTVAETEAFLEDDRPDAYERLIDRLLASPHLGERWGRRWLDRARYADTNGYEKDRERSIWPYRDWVINALNADKPFDRFTVEQIAGDMLPNATTDQIVATGFHRNTMINEEGGIDVEEFRFASMVDRVATTGAVWLGLTIGCAQCHSHKYDPISQRDYYRLFAFLDNADEPEIDLLSAEIYEKRRKAESEIADLESSLPEKFPAFASGRSEKTLVGPLLPIAEQRRRRLEAHLGAWERSIRPIRWTPLTPIAPRSRKNATMTILEDRSVLASGDKPNNDVYEVEFDLVETGASGLRLEVLTHPSLPNDGPGRAPLFSVGDFLLTEFQAFRVSDSGASTPLKLRNASEDYREGENSAARSIDGITDTGWSVKGGVGKPHSAVFEFAEDPGVGRIRLVLHQEYIHQMTIGRFRVSVTTDRGNLKANGFSDELEEALLVGKSKRTTEQERLILERFLATTEELKEERAGIDRKRSGLPKYPTTMVMRERAPAHRRSTRIHARGEFLKASESVEPGIPEVLPALPEGASPDRLGFAEWLASAENPLVGRVIMNQTWQAYFGRGIVSTVEDFGVRGEAPTHPELLDWLADEFVRQGRSLKAMHRLIVMSSTYRQDSRITPDRLAADPRNVLLSRAPRIRVEAETVRDLALAAAGLLTRRIGGPSVYPPQPEGVTAVAYGQVAWKPSTGPDRYRRGLYTYIKRTAPFAAFATFDMPTSEATCVRRERSNTPLQALTMLNDPVFIEAARALGRRLIDDAPGATEDRAGLLFKLCANRSPSADERSRIARFHDRAFSHYRTNADDARRVVGVSEKDAPADTQAWAAWTVTARAVLNLDETITRE